MLATQLINLIIFMMLKLLWVRTLIFYITILYLIQRYAIKVLVAPPVCGALEGGGGGGITRSGRGPGGRGPGGRGPGGRGPGGRGPGGRGPGGRGPGGRGPRLARNT